MNDEMLIFEKYMDIREALVRPARKEGEEAKFGSARKFGAVTGISADTSTAPALGDMAGERMRNQVKQDYIDFCMSHGEYLDIKDIMDECPREKRGIVEAFASELDSISENILETHDYKIFYFDFPKMIEILNQYAKQIIDDPTAKDGAAYIRNEAIKAFQTMLNDKIHQKEEDPDTYNKLPSSYRDLLESWMSKKSRIRIDPIGFAKDPKNHWYSQPMTTSGETSGTGVKTQKAFIKARTDDEGRGSKADLMPTGSGEEGFGDREVKVNRPLGKMEPERMYKPVEYKTPHNLAGATLANPDREKYQEQPKKKETPKKKEAPKKKEESSKKKAPEKKAPEKKKETPKKKVTKESYQFFKIISF